MDRHFKPSFCGDRKMPTTKLVALALATSRMVVHLNDKYMHCSLYIGTGYNPGWPFLGKL
jgi:hypothetical protein